MFEPSRSLSLHEPSERGGAVDRPRAVWVSSGLTRAAPALLQNWKLIVGFTILVLAAVIAALPLVQPRYLVTAKVLVQLGRELAAPPTVTTKEVAQQIVTAKRPEDLGSEMEIIKSPQLMEELVQAFGVDYFLAEPPAKTLFQHVKRAAKRIIRFARETISQGLVLLGVRRPVSPFERVVRALQDSLSVEEIRRSDVISIQLSTSSPDQGVEILNKFLDLFQEKHREIYRLPKVREFFTAELDDVRRQLEAAEHRVQSYKEENRAWAITDQAGLMLKTQRDLTDAHAKTLSDIAELGDRMAELQRQETALPRELQTSRLDVRDPVVDDLRKQLAAAEAQAAQIGVTFGEKSPQMLGLRRQAAELRATIQARQPVRRDQETTAVNPRLLEVQRELATSRTQLAGLHERSAQEEQQLKALNLSIQKLTATGAALRELEREVERLERKYQLYSTGLEDSRISEQMDLAKISNLRIISQPAAGVLPVWPKLTLVFLGALIIGLGGSVAFILLREALQPVVRSRRDVEDLLGVPVLAAMSEQRALR